MRSAMKPFEPADIVFIEMLKARHESLKAQLAAAKRAPQDAQHAAEIAAELREMVDKATAEFFRITDRLAAHLDSNPTNNR
jgi:F0F1-type ATP synthase membrane subunit b/b'